MQSKKVCSIDFKSSFLITGILCKSLNKNCLTLLSLVERYMNVNLFFHSECSSAKLIFQVLMPTGSMVEFFLSIL